MARIAAVLVALLATACATRPCERPNLSPDEQWNVTYDYLVRVANGGSWQNEKLLRAVSFFEEKTGIESGLLRPFGFIVLNRQQLRIALERWSRWRYTGGET